MNEPSKLKLITKRPEAGNVVSFVFETGGLEWLAGQNQGYVLPHEGETNNDNEHWFTISSAPSEGVITISTRVSDSVFKQALNQLQPGDEIERHDLDGDFTWQDASDQPVVLVAAGIGITPFRSILVERAATAKPLSACLLYFNRDEAIPFQAELNQLAEDHPELTIRYVTGQPVSADTIMELAPQAASQTVYLSGPEPMVEAVGGDLKERGVTVKQDRFPGYDEANY